VEAFTKLQEQLTDTEDKIQAARRFYNTNVMAYNTKLETFPTNMISGPFGFVKSEFFQLENASEREPVAVKF
jgi:LemA protein